MSNNLTIQLLAIYLVFTAFTIIFVPAAALDSTDFESMITSPSRAYKVEARVTAAPKLRRQEAINYCDEWSVVNGPLIGCYTPNTCLFTSLSGTGFAYCGVSGGNYRIATVCSDYTALTVTPPYETTHCDSVNPYCNTADFIADSSETYTMFGCDATKGTLAIAYPTIQSSAYAGSSASSTTVEYAPTTTTSRSTPSPSPAPASSAPSAVNTAAAIGGALGGFASVIVAILAVYKFWTKNRKPLNP